LAVAERTGARNTRALLAAAVVFNGCAIMGLMETG
jgi:hypothetical protein